MRTLIFVVAGAAHLKSSYVDAIKWLIFNSAIWIKVDLSCRTLTSQNLESGLIILQLPALAWEEWDFKEKERRGIEPGGEESDYRNGHSSVVHCILRGCSTFPHTPEGHEPPLGVPAVISWILIWTAENWPLMLYSFTPAGMRSQYFYRYLFCTKCPLNFTCGFLPDSACTWLVLCTQLQALHMKSFLCNKFRIN